MFNLFQCLPGVNTVLCVQVSVYYFTDVCKIQTSAIGARLNNIKDESAQGIALTKEKYKMSLEEKIDF